MMKSREKQARRQIAQTDMNTKLNILSLHSRATFLPHDAQLPALLTGHSSLRLLQILLRLEM